MKTLSVLLALSALLLSCGTGAAAVDVEHPYGYASPKDFSTPHTDWFFAGRISFKAEGRAGSWAQGLPNGNYGGAGAEGTYDGLWTFAPWFLNMMGTALPGTDRGCNSTFLDTLARRGFDFRWGPDSLTLDTLTTPPVPFVRDMGLQWPLGNWSFDDITVYTLFKGRQVGSGFPDLPLQWGSDSIGFIAQGSLTYNICRYGHADDIYFEGYDLMKGLPIKIVEVGFTKCAECPSPHIKYSFPIVDIWIQVNSDDVDDYTLTSSPQW